VLLLEAMLLGVVLGGAASHPLVGAAVTRQHEMAGGPVWAEAEWLREQFENARPSFKVVKKLT
jgi:hypothetical protein